jgi:hypothetical protein
LRSGGMHLFCVCALRVNLILTCTCGPAATIPAEMKEVYFGKTQETTKRLRYLDGGASRQAGAMLRQAFMEAAGDK